MEKNLVLIGFMGTGKSTVGKYLAQKLNRQFVELDEEIVQKAGKPIPQIFAEDGETTFRKIEAQVVEEWSKGDNLIISTGGGAVLNPQNVENLRQKGILFCLTARPEVILARVEKDTNRPLLAVEDRLEKIQELLAQRAPFYQGAADYLVDGSDLTLREVGEHILGFLGGLTYGENENLSRGK